MSEDDNVAAGWYEATRVASPERPRLNFDLDVDVCVIGAGLAGLTVAREVAQRGWSVAVLEGGRVACAASGRNTGFVLPGFSEHIESMVERIGLDHTKQLWALSEQGIDYVRRAVAETGMPGVDPVPGWLHVSKTDNSDEIDAEVERLRWIGAAVEAWPTQRVREVLPNKRYFGALHFPGAIHIHPLNYALGLAADAEKFGARIFENTPAIGIDPAGVRKRVDTPEARVRAAHVVLACNVQVGDLMPRLGATLLPITTFVLVTEPIPRLTEIVRYRGAVSDTNRADNHYRIVGGADSGGERLQWSGRMRAWQADPHWVRRGLLTDIKRNFPDLGAVEIAHLWRGTLGRAVHRMPQIGEIESGLWVASGFGGHGLNTTAMGGELVARGIVETDADLAAVRALRAGVGRRPARPGAGARHLLGDAAGRAARARLGALPRTGAHTENSAACRRQRARAASGHCGGGARGGRSAGARAARRSARLTGLSHQIRRSRSAGRPACAKVPSS